MGRGGNVLVNVGGRSMDDEVHASLDTDSKLAMG